MLKTLTKILVLIACGAFLIYGVSNIFAPIKFYELDLERENLEFVIPGKLDMNGLTLQQVRDDMVAKNREFTFAMNGGMFNPLFQPVGLTIINGEVIHPLITKTTGFGNFFLQPNGVFMITQSGQASVMTTAQFAEVNNMNISNATQSGPMLVVDGLINPLFTVGSENREIRNGVCVLDNGHIVFAISRRPINFYDFASFFKKHGCMNALYLDGSISKAMIPSQWFSTDGSLGMVMVGYQK
jgi:uncharacterized protein YigE (DUF2233 family)